MKRFLRLILGLVSVLIVLNLILYYFILDKENSRFYSYYGLIDRLKKKHYKMLITGDSHANSAWKYVDDPDVLNFSYFGDNQLDIKRKLIFLQKNGYSFDYHLMEIDPQVLSSYRQSTNNNDLSLNYVGDINWIKIQTYFPLFFNSRIWAEMLGSIRQTKIEEPDNSGSITAIAMKNRAETQFLSGKFSKEMSSLMEETIELSRENEMIVTMINYPIYGPYIDLIDTSGAYQDATESAKALAFGYKIRVLNFERLVCDSVNFANQDHLNKKGAMILTSHVMRCMESEECNPPMCIDKEMISN